MNRVQWSAISKTKHLKKLSFQNYQNYNRLLNINYNISMDVWREDYEKRLFCGVILLCYKICVYYLTDQFVASGDITWCWLVIGHYHSVSQWAALVSFRWKKCKLRRSLGSMRWVLVLPGLDVDSETAKTRTFTPGSPAL